LAKVIVCGEVFVSTQIKTKRLDAEQDAARLAFEHLQQQDQQQSDDTSAATASENMMLIVSVNDYSAEFSIWFTNIHDNVCF